MPSSEYPRCENPVFTSAENGVLVNVVVSASSVVVSDPVEIVSDPVEVVSDSVVVSKPIVVGWFWNVVVSSVVSASVAVIVSFVVVSVVFEGLVGHGGEQSFDLQEHFGQGTPSSCVLITLLGVWKSTWKVYPFLVNFMLPFNLGFPGEHLTVVVRVVTQPWLTDIAQLNVFPLIVTVLDTTVRV